METIKIETYVNNLSEYHIKYEQSINECFAKLISFGFHKTPSRHAYGPVSRDYIMIHFVDQGEGEVVCGDTRYHVTKGSCFAFFPDQTYRYISNEVNPWVYYYIGFYSNKPLEILKNLGFRENKITRQFKCNDVAISIIKSLCSEMGKPTEYYKQLSCLYDILHNLTADLKINDLSGTERGSTRISEKDCAYIVSGLINHNFMEDLNIASLASDLGISPGYLGVVFKKNFGVSIYKYLMERRISVAKELLRVTDKSVKKIAYEVGYADPLYFSKIFRKYTGLTPSKFRARQSDL